MTAIAGEESARSLSRRERHARAEPGLLQAVKLARRELRGGLAGFRIFFACLILGVAAIATVQSVSSGILDTLQDDGRAILGGDIAARTQFTDITPDQLSALNDIAETVSSTTQMRAMARDPESGDAILVDLKAVDEPYPLYGAMELRGGGSLDDALAERGGTRGAVIELPVAARLGVEVGDTITLGEAGFEIRDIIVAEPDRAGGAGFAFGPRVMIADAGLAATDLIREGSMIDYYHRLRLPEGLSASAAEEALRAAAPDADWRLRTFDRASPSLEQIVQQITLFLTLVGLTALLVGGVGVSNAVRAFVEGRTPTIATLKCLGATSRLIFQTYLIQVLVLATGAIVIGLAIGAATPPLVSTLLADLLPFSLRTGVYPGALAIAALFGLLTALTFSLWPLARVRDVSAAALFREAGGTLRGWSRGAVAAVAVSGLALAGLAIGTARDPEFAAWFVVGSLATLVVFRLIAGVVVASTRRLGTIHRPLVRLAMANLNRPGAPTVNVVLSLGLGVTVLVAIVLIEGNLKRQIEGDLPDRAPSFFFVDIQADQRDAFVDTVSAFEGVSDLRDVPSLRGRIAEVNGVPAEDALVDGASGWVVRGDRGVTYAAEPENRDIVAGDWWAPDYAGPPLVSIYSDIAEAFAIGVGDTMTVRILGRDIEAEVANVRDIDWGTLGINFTMVFSPTPLNAAPHTYIATLHAADAATETALQRAVAAEFGNVTTVNIRQALDTFGSILERLIVAVRAIAAVTIVAGTLVLAGAVAAGHRRRVYEAVVLKVLGATRGKILRGYALEYGLMGLLTGIVAAVLGTLAAWIVVTQVMDLDWVFLPLTIVATTILCIVITVALGFVGTWRALSRKAAPLLRNE
ncbi:FtsX-like permease family protein [Fodinicurvata sp. EGI_FJ10296]|uniref:ABC transporter permease n=1 Tax=Fodinicurvata sp. EGI_FJ10296 TaxID=3231908 RepID=UPI0034515C7C